MKVDVSTYQNLVERGELRNPGDKWTTREPDYFESGIASVQTNEEGAYELPNEALVAYVVWVQYETGGTFGSSQGLLSLVDVFDSQEDALELKDFIVEDYHKWDDQVLGTDLSFDFKGKTHQKEWVGYFNRLEQVHIEPINIDNKKL